MGSRLHWAWISLAVCFVNVFVNYSIRLGFGVVLPEMIRDLGLNRTQGGTIFNVYLAVYICLTPLAGNLTDRFGARRVITLFGILLGAGALLMGRADSLVAACLAFGLAGAGASAMWTPVVTAVQRWFGSRWRGKALGILSTGYGFGFAATGWLFPLLVGSFSWRVCWYALGLWVFVMILVNGFLLRSQPEDLHLSPWREGSNAIEGGLRSDATPRGGRYREVFHLDRFWLIGISFCLASLPLYCVTTFIVDYANVELGWSYDRASFLATVHGLSQVLGVLTIPVLSDRIGRRLTIIGTNALIAVSIFGILAAGRSLLGLYVSTAFFGIFYGATWPMYAACGGDYFRKEVMGTVIGAWTPLYGLGAISAHFLGGRIRDVTGSFQLAFYLSIVFALGASFLIFKVKPPRGTR